jgi:hypothetical protein
MIKKAWSSWWSHQDGPSDFHILKLPVNGLMMRISFLNWRIWHWALPDVQAMRKPIGKKERDPGVNQRVITASTDKKVEKS